MWFPISAESTEAPCMKNHLTVLLEHPVIFGVKNANKLSHPDRLGPPVKEIDWARTIDGELIAIRQVSNKARRILFIDKTFMQCVCFSQKDKTIPISNMGCKHS